jgi:hypothetical protein
MERPQVRQIEGQRTEEVREVTGWEAEQLLRKYSQGEYFSTRGEEVKPISVISDNGLSFEDMVRLEEEKRQAEKMRNISQQSGPRPTTFDGSRGYESEVKWESDEDTGFGFKIEITTDMKLPRY